MSFNNTIMEKERNMDFINFCKEHEELFLVSLVDIVSCIPSDMNKLDNRFDISNFYCNELERDFSPNLIEDASIGFDMRYNNEKRISIKFSGKIFQPTLRNRINLGVPGNIMLKNYLSTSTKTDKVSGFDYLLAVEKNIDRIKGEVSVGFGVINILSVQKYVVKNNTDQQHVKIPNKAWDYFSGVKSFPIKLDDDKQNKRYAYSKKFMFDLLRGVI